MKILSIYSKLNFRLLILIILFPTLILSCKKDTELKSKSEITKPSVNKNIANEFGRESTITPNNVRTWLENQHNDSTPRKNEIIQAVLENMIDVEMYNESFRDDENFIIVPLNRSYISEHININNIPPIQYLLLVENSNGEIRRGDIVLFYPNELNVINLPENSFHDLFLNNTSNVDGTFTLITLGDFKQFEIDFENNKLSQFRLWQGRVADEPSEGGQICIEWYLVTTIYYFDGHTEYFENYLYTSCFGFSNGGGGSGGGNGNGTIYTPPVLSATSKEVTMEVATRQSQYEIWTMNAFYKLIGYRDPNNSSFNCITQILPNADDNGNVANVHFTTATQTSQTTTYYAVFGVTSNYMGTQSNSSKAWANFTGSLTYPNIQNDIQYHNNAHTWFAATEFY